MLTYVRPIVNCTACVLSRFNKRKSVSQSSQDKVVVVVVVVVGATMLTLCECVDFLLLLAVDRIKARASATVAP